MNRLKNKLDKLESARPKPEPDNVIYTAIWGHEADMNDKDFIAAWKENGAEVKQYRQENGDIKEVMKYKTHWAAGGVTGE